MPLPVLQPGVGKAIQRDAMAQGMKTYLEALIRRLHVENPIFLEWVVKHSEASTNPSEAIEAALLAYRLLEVQQEVDELEI